jgi:hypothetical protein
MSVEAPWFRFWMVMASGGAGGMDGPVGLGHVRNAAAFLAADDPSSECLFLAAECLDLEGLFRELASTRQQPRTYALARASPPPPPPGSAGTHISGVSMEDNRVANWARIGYEVLASVSAKPRFPLWEGGSSWWA